MMVSTDPQFNIVGCCSGQVLCKPWRVVELTACTVKHAVSTIPENVFGIEYGIVVIPGCVATALAEEIVSYEIGNTVVC